MSELMQASNQWASRPQDERFTSITAMLDHFAALRDNSRSIALPARKLTIRPAGDESTPAGMWGIRVHGPEGQGYGPTHWAFGQLATKAQLSADTLRKLPAPLVADCLNWRLQHDDSECSVYLQKLSDPTFAALMGPNYGRVHNASILAKLADRFGDGVTGDWRVPGEFGKAVEVTKANTTLFGSDRDMFVFLADEKNRIEVPDRRNGSSGMMARGFFVWNSETGSRTLGVKTFLFDYVCCNRIVWGAGNVQTVKIRHTSGAPDRWADEVAPALAQYREESATPIVSAIANAKAAKLNNPAEWLGKRFSKGIVQAALAAHVADEDRPIETVWDAVTGLTAAARSIPHQDARVDLEEQAGALMSLTA